MSNNDTQPLTPEQASIIKEQAPNAWNDLMNHPLTQAFKQLHEEANQHVHGPFVFLMNQNHNALRGCVTCGQAWVGLMAGEAKGLVWHPVGELAEEE